MKKVLVSAALVWVGAAMLLAQGPRPAKPAAPTAPAPAAAPAAQAAAPAAAPAPVRTAVTVASPADAPKYQAMLKQYCFACHSSKAPQPGNDPVNLEVASLDNLLPHAETWERVLRKLSVRAMPPQGAPHPPEAEYAAFTSWLSASLDQAWKGKSTPGRYVVHRLNRTEYGNAIRDLLALDVDTSELLPSDGADFGFDNIATSLRTSPLLLERYLTAAQQVSPTDSRLKTEYATVPSPQGNGSIKGYLARPASAGSNKLPSILVVHENRGLNPHIEDVARRLALENFMAFAPDGLTSVGGYPGDDAKGGELFGKVDRTKMSEDLYAAAVWLKSRPDSTGKLGVTGFCFGGGIANALAVRMGSDLAAAVPFYGGAPPAADVPKIKAAVLVHHGGEDTRLVMAWPEYENAMKAAKVTYEGHIYPGAVHGFNNDATPQRYNKAAADEAWKRTVAWFNKYVRG